MIALNTAEWTWGNYYKANGIHFDNLIPYYLESIEIRQISEWSILADGTLSWDIFQEITQGITHLWR